MTALATLAAIGGTAGGEQAGPGLGLLGMGLLVAVLVILSIVVPRIRAGKSAPRAEIAPESPELLQDEEVAAAVAALHAMYSELDQLESVHLTWRLYEKPYRPWRLAGRAEFLLGKQSVHNRARKRSS